LGFQNIARVVESEIRMMAEGYLKIVVGSCSGLTFCQPPSASLSKTWMT